MLESLAKSVRDMLEPIFENDGYEILDLAFHGGRKRWLLRITADRFQGRITIDDLVKLNKLTGDVLDREDMIPHSYSLEISSPGLDRPLMHQRDFQRHHGEQIRVLTREPIGNINDLQGYISEVNDNVIVLKLTDESIMEIDYENIAKANLIIEV